MTKINPNNTQPTETTSLAGTSEAAGLAGAASPETGGPVRSRLVSGWRFTRHLLEMVAAMVVGMALLGAAIWALGEPPGFANLLVEYGWMGASMTVPMVAWMRYRGHSWSDGGEMTAAMLVPVFALVLPTELGVAGYVPGLSDDSLMMLSHVAMIGGMAALMIYRRDRYAHRAHDHRAYETPPHLEPSRRLKTLLEGGRRMDLDTFWSRSTCWRTKGGKRSVRRPGASLGTRRCFLRARS